MSLVGARALSYANQIGDQIQNSTGSGTGDRILDELRSDTYAVASSWATI